MRGANLRPNRLNCRASETSPHAWSKPSRLLMQRALHRNSSTCVEQTCSRRSHRRPGRKHLHMRGANRFASDPLDKDLETSPHAWSKPFGRLIQMILTGNISTCVEQTHTGPETSGHHKKHLHMRGANRMKLDAQLIEMETSPHAWSKLLVPVAKQNLRRNISTCVEQTPSACPR